MLSLPWSIILRWLFPRYSELEDWDEEQSEVPATQGEMVSNCYAL